MYAVIRSCKYCALNGRCPYRDEIRIALNSFRLEASAVINCKRVTPYVAIGNRASFYVWRGNTKNDDEKDIVSGIVIGYLKDRSGHPRTYIIKTEAKFKGYFKDGSNDYWIDDIKAREQYPDVHLERSEIIVFIKYVNIQNNAIIEETE